MKNRLVTLLVVLSMLFVFVGSAAAAPSVTYLGGIWADGQVIFTFRVDQDFGGKWLHANVSSNDGSMQITCTQDGDIVRCIAPRSVADKSVTVTFQGAGFRDYVKSQAEGKNCYSAFDYGGPDTPADPSNPADWYDFGPYCQDEPASFDATEPTIIYNPVYDETFPYWYWYENCYGDSFGDGFYYDCWGS